ncbi:hypothetical protein GCK72_011455 [Caenorhabditis remanei]|uniref:non-specific serine/threonine protein kinase n=1 Tax=Caenorhabditis remanei TaxID=31234 RepID=A0A6A5H813_CAERE|nr:hypothetical protein GCK72_011455 [Caenorhabditis remanei]KAF1763189.1 hypothetical protein GCK72_011455 [Caenorhabditis remanei]
MEVPLNLIKTENARRAAPNMKCMADFVVEKRGRRGLIQHSYCAREKEGAKREVALKVCLKRLILKNKMVEYIHREKEALAELSKKENSHPGVVILYATFQDSDSLYFVLSYAKYGDLWSLIQKQPNNRLTVNDARYYSASLLDVLVHIHSLGIIHRDIKSENVLIKEDGRILLTDFGSAKILKDFSQNKNDTNTQEKREERQPTGRRRSFVGTAQFVTPELLTAELMSPASDIWSFAVTLYQFLDGKFPFEDVSEYLIFRRIQAVLYQFSDDFSDENAKDLIERVLIKEPSARLTSDQIKKHKFYESIDWNKLAEIQPPNIYL